MNHVFLGWDPRDSTAYDVAVKSIEAHAKSDVGIFPLKIFDLRNRGLFFRGYRVDGSGQMWDDRDGKPFSTEFSFTRFCVPLLCQDLKIEERVVLFADPDILLRTDISELFDLWDDQYSVMCVKHQMIVEGGQKMDGVIQVPNTHGRKNWSSVMLMDWRKCLGEGGLYGLSKLRVNNTPGSDLHAMIWVKDEEIGELPEEWNHLVGYSETKEPKLVHYTLGTPDFPGHENDEYADEWRAYEGSR